MKIEISSKVDLKKIFELYEAATNYQSEKKGVTIWPKFKESIIVEEIAENRQLKIIVGNEIACIWAITFSDREIWQERENENSIYIHRIATNPAFRGRNFVQIIVDWAKEYCITNKKKYIRLDTVGENIKLIEHYTKCGFTFLGLSKLKNTDELPAHYENATVSLFEIKL